MEIEAITLLLTTTKLFRKRHRSCRRCQDGILWQPHPRAFTFNKRGGEG